MVEEFRKLMYMGPKGSFEPSVSEPTLKVEPMKCKGVGSLIQTLRGFCQALEEDASWCEEEERVLGVRMPWGAP